MEQRTRTLVAVFSGFLVALFCVSSPPRLVANEEGDSGSSQKDEDARWARQEESSGRPLEEIETTDGERFRGRVVGYDSEKKGYILRQRNGDAVIPEQKVIRVRQLALHPSEPGSSVWDDTATSGSSETAARGSAEAVSQNATRALLDGLSSYPEPTSVAAARFYREGIGHFRRGALAKARQALEKSLSLSASDLATQLAVALLDLVEQNYEAAYRRLRGVTDRHPGDAVTVELRSRVAKNLGYAELARRLEEDGIQIRYRGAERHYRLAHARMSRADFSGAREAWKNYLALDPDLTRVKSREGSLFHDGKRLLEEGAHREALIKFAQAVDINPFLGESLRPYRVRALERSAAAHLEHGEYGLHCSDLEALELEEPSRAGEFRHRRRRGEKYLVRQRLQAVDNSTDTVKALMALAPWVPDLQGSHKDVVEKHLERLAPRERFQEVLLKGELGNELPKGQREFAAHWCRWLDELLSEKVQGPLDRSRQERSAREAPNHREDSRESRDIHRRSERIGGFPRRRDEGSALVAPVEDSSAAVGGEDRFGQKPVSREPEPPSAVASGRGKPVAVPNEDSDLSDVVSASTFSPDASSFFPLQIGSRWAYRHSDGTLDVRQLERVDDHPRYGRVYRYRSYFQIGDLKIPYRKSCFRDSEHLFLGNDTDAASADRLLRLPVRQGKKWSWRSGDILFERVYESTDEVVRCRAGTFKDCVKVRASSRYRFESSQEVVQWFYFAKGVGLVKLESENPADGFELESFKITGGDTNDGDDHGNDRDHDHRDSSKPAGPAVPREFLSQPSGEE